MEGLTGKSMLELKIILDNIIFLNLFTKRNMPPKKKRRVERRVERRVGRRVERRVGRRKFPVKGRRVGNNHVVVSHGN